mmetsp:Transcript_107881/g.292516  ORF Transcript_107881/g.292516 Transcript_107881/m.292516 type:complete len:170 (+) Transcript_107881:24-533(+)
MRRNDSGATPAPLPIGAKGDPHMVNIHGQRFDLMQPGVHSLVHIPKHSQALRTLLDIKADVRRIGQVCSDMYVQAINVTGAWTRKSGQQYTVFFSVGEPRQEDVGWQDFGTVSMKVVHAHTKKGIAYLNFLIRHLSKVAYSVGGLLGEDDHTEAARADPACMRRALRAV